tara:strand:+ start:495 stop:899 length:405 start_codon:yes stop_codon:yes gene_type:complete
MGFKLGSEKGNYAINGEIQRKLKFNKVSGDPDASVPGTPVIRKKLQKGIMGEANNDGTIFIDKKVVPGSNTEKHILMHEMVHMTDMRLGKLAYSDNAVKWEGEVYPRKDGHILYDDQWLPEGSKDFPWEKMPWE